MTLEQFLPNELVQYIFGLLDLPDHLRVAAVSKLWRESALESLQAVEFSFADTGDLPEKSKQVLHYVKNRCQRVRVIRWKSKKFYTEHFNLLPESLTHLELCNCKLAKVAKGKAAVEPLPPTISHLDLSGYGKISTANLQRLFSQTTRLRSLNVSKCSRFHDVSIIAANKDMVELRAAHASIQPSQWHLLPRNLELLDLTGMRGGTEPTREDVSSLPRTLKVLVLDFTRYTLSRYHAARLPAESLEKLSMRSLTTLGVPFVLPSMEKLQELDLSRTNVTDACIAETLEGGKQPHLRNLILTSCPGLNGHFVNNAEVQHALKRLDTINLARCSNLEEENLRRIKQLVPTVIV